MKKLLSRRAKKLSPFLITIFIRQLATLLTAGVAINEALITLENSQSNMLLRELIQHIRNDLHAGKNLSASMRHYSQYFDSLTIQLVKLGEHTGTLDSILLSLAQHHENKWLLSKKIKQAMFYPVIILFCALIMLCIMLTFVIPRFADLFADMQDKLPLFTRFIFHLSASFCTYGWVCLLIILISLITLHVTGHLKLNILPLLTRIPIIRNYNRHVLLSRLARHLSLCYKSGLSLTDTLRLIIHADSPAPYARIIFQVRNTLNAGSSLHAAMSAHDFFPIFMIQFIKTGEESGKLDEMLDKVAMFYEADIEQFIARLSQLLEPLIMIILGVLIGGLVTGMYLPIFNLGSAL